ncbi:MAG: hypothetical protein J1F35_04740 [Erysipelotrichales bacterium]|nr:hypothetical protein [Erysipelotrichales bacterium]
MKKFKFVSLLMVLAVMLFGGVLNVTAAESIPDSVVSDGLREVAYLQNEGKAFPVIMKTADNGKYYIYCMNMSATYAEGVKFTKTGEVDPGYVYILNAKLGLNDKDKEFFIKQMAVWFYEDYLTGTEFNLVREVREYIVSNVNTDPVAGEIYKLYNGAKQYKKNIDKFAGRLEIDKSAVTFTVDGDYYVSSKIKIYQENLSGNIKYSLTSTPAGSKVVKDGEDGVRVKIPTSKIPEGKQLTFTLNVEGSYIKYTGYYYYHSNKYQKMLFQEPLEAKEVLKDSITMNIKHYKENHEINISKTDVTQSHEVPGATLVVKDANGKEIESWISTNESHKITLKSGEYSLTETLAPTGYKLSKVTIYFKIDVLGGIYIKNENGNYVNVDKVVMINELIDVVSVAKKDSKTGKYVSGAKLVIKDEKGNVIEEFTTNDTVHRLSLKSGKYTLSEVSAPVGYLLSDEIIEFEVFEDGTLRVMNNKGDYVDSAILTFYNTPESEKSETIIDVEVPATGKTATLLIVGGIALLIGGIACAKKTIKEC